MLIDTFCKTCNKPKEILAKREDILPDGSISPTCEKCDCGGELKKKDGITAGNFHLKGKGWARDSYS